MKTIRAKNNARFARNILKIPSAFNFSKIWIAFIDSITNFTDGSTNKKSKNCYDKLNKSG
jgi:hypothetical protein